MILTINQKAGHLNGMTSVNKYVSIGACQPPKNITAVMFFGGWQAPIDTYLFTEVIPFKWPAFWLIVKIIGIVTMFLWIRATFPRYRYDQIMRLGWKVFIPLTIVWIVVVGVWMQTPWNIWR